MLLDTPAGISTTAERSPFTRPSPRHTAQGDWIDASPSPAQVGQGDTDTNWPNTLRVARRTSPLPPQVLQVTGLVPSAAPLPAQVSQRTRVLSLMVRFEPVATSVQGEAHRDADVLAPACLGRRPAAAEQRVESTHAAEVAHEHAQRFVQVDVVEPLRPGAAAPVRPACP